MKNLAELRAECASLGIQVETKGRVSKGLYLTALRDYHWRKEHPDEPLSVQVMPMLLGSWDDLTDVQVEAIEDDQHAWLVQPKMDGVRALMHIEGDCVRITSRTVSEVTYRLSEFQDNLPHLSEGLSRLSGCILDGELVCPAGRLDTGSTVAASPLQATMAILATSPSKARHFQGSQKAHLRYHVFDILRYCGQDVTPLPLSDRLDFLAIALGQLGNEYIEPVPSFVVNKPEVHRRIIDAGGEGTVWKKADSAYEPGRRICHWIKRKRGIELEAFVSGFKLGNNGHAHLIGALEFSVLGVDGTSTPIAWVSGWTDQERAAMSLVDRCGMVSLNPNYLGRNALLSGQDIAARSERLRHARLVRWCKRPNLVSCDDLSHLATASNHPRLLRSPN